jgi:hypothetical protein
MAAASALTDAVTRHHDQRLRHGLRAVAIALGCGLVLWARGATAQPATLVTLDAGDLQQRANRVLAVMAYSVVPDVTSSALSIQDTQTGSAGLSMVQAAGGFTLSGGRPLYLEGGLAASQYDPQFVVGGSRQAQTVPARWTGLSGTGGIGWDFRLGPDLVWRPIANIAVGRVSSELKLPGFRPDTQDAPAFDFLGHGHLDAWGLGGSVMLDYERYRSDSEIDAELRYTAIRLRSFGSTASAVQGQADAITASLWTRYRAPTGILALERPLRYVLEYAHTNYLGDQAGILGFHYLNSVGLGLELDTSAHDAGVTRTRLMLRYVFGGEVSGASVGLAVSF